MKKHLILLFSFLTITFYLSQAPLNTRTFETNLTAEYPGFIKHLNENTSETYYSAFTYNTSQVIKKFGSDGLLQWKTSLTDATSLDLSLSKYKITIDKNDNIIVCFTPSQFGNNYNFIDSDGILHNLTVSYSDKVVIKINKNGKLLWKRKFPYTYGGQRSSVVTDNNNDVYLLSTNQDSDGNHFLIDKIDGETGNLIFNKDYEGVNVYSVFSLFDSQNNFYIFLDSKPNGNDYNFDGIIVNTNFFGDNLMLKYNTSGNIISGNNFHNDGVQRMQYSILSDGIFDGNNIILLGYLMGTNTENFFGLNNFEFSRKYSTVQHQGLLAKIDLNGNVIWQKPLYSNTNVNRGLWTNLNIDAEKNIYGYLYFKDKVTINNTEYQFDNSKGNKVISKFDTNGNVIYLNAVDLSRDVTDSYSSTMIDVIDNDVYNITGVTNNNYFLNYPLYNQFIPKNYIATFGNLNKKYLSPQKNYIDLNNISVTNNSENANVFEFNLINNVNWNATSDQNWLSLSSVKLTQDKNGLNVLSGNGDAKLTLTAETNNSVNSRSGTVLINGDGGVASKTIVVTQTGLLSSQEAKTFVTVIYPNPTSDILNIQTEQKISKIEILDTSGKLVKSNSGSGKTINVSNLSKGIYLIKIYSDKNIINSKFIKN